MDKVVYKSLKPNYLLYIGYEGNLKCAEIYIRNDKLSESLKASMLYTYTGTYWINPAGGSVWKKKGHHKRTTEYIISVLNVDPEDTKKIREWFKDVEK